MNEVVDVVVADELEVEFDLESLVTSEEYSAYGVWKVLNKIATVTNVTLSESMKNRPQMMYNYARNGVLVKGESVKKNTYVSRKYSRDEVIEFLNKYFASRV
jgi:hypothetical protein